MMEMGPEQLSERPRPRLSAAVRVLLYLAMTGIVMLVASVVVLIPVMIFSPHYRPGLQSIEPSFAMITVMWVLMFPGVLATTWLFVTFLDRRPFETIGIARQGSWRSELGLGLLLGFGLPTLIFGISYLAGWTHPTDSLFAHSPVRILVVLLQTVSAMAAVAVSEEIMMRGYILQTLRSRYGTVSALVISTLIFGVAHLSNPGAGIMPFIGILVAGLGLGYAYLATNRLWLPIGFHFAWNFTLGPVLGFPVSGIDITGWIEQVSTGPMLWTGGQFGPEAGLIGFIAWIPAVFAIRAFAGRISRP